MARQVFVKTFSCCGLTRCLESRTSQDTDDNPGANKCCIYEIDHELMDMANRHVRRTSGMPDSHQHLRLKGMFPYLYFSSLGGVVVEPAGQP